MGLGEKRHLLAAQPLWHGAELWGRMLLLRQDHVQVPSIILFFCQTKRSLRGGS